MHRVFGDDFATVLQTAAGYTAAQFERRNKEVELTARVLQQAVAHLRKELVLNEAEGDDPALQAAVLTLLDQCDYHLDGWATYCQSNYNRAADLLAAAEHLYKAADLTYRASHPPVRPYEQWAAAPPHHRYAVDLVTAAALLPSALLRQEQVGNES